MKNPSKTSPIIFEYLDFRVFLKDYYDYQKANTPHFSYRNFAKAGGIPLSSASILAAVIKGTRNLSQSYMVKFSLAMKLADRESNFFKNLIQFNQSKSMEEKNYFFSLISKVRGSRAAIIKKSQAKFYSCWYYVVVWNYLCSHPKNSSPQEVAKKIFPSISVNQAKEAIQLLIDLGLIQRLANGYKPVEQHLSTEKNTGGAFTREYMRELITMSSQILPDVPQAFRQYNALVFSLSEKGFSTIKDRMRTFQEELRTIIEKDKEEDRVYTLTMQLYPNTKVFE